MISAQTDIIVWNIQSAKTWLTKVSASAVMVSGLLEKTMPTVKILMSVPKDVTTVEKTLCVLILQDLLCAFANLGISKLMTIPAQNIMSV